MSGKRIKKLRKKFREETGESATKAEFRRYKKDYYEIRNI